jgi:hypothetical protein
MTQDKHNNLKPRTIDFFLCSGGRISPGTERGILPNPGYSISFQKELQDISSAKELLY